MAELSRRIRHLYDICLIFQEDEYRNFCRSEEFSTLCQQCIEDERVGFFKYSECLEKPLSDAPLFSEFESWSESLESTYKGPFSRLVYGEFPELDEIDSTLNLLKDCLNKTP